MPDRFEAAAAAIDAANALDPNQVVIDGVAHPKELLHAAVVERWLRAVDPEATELQVLAARAHHFRRWVVPRSDYPAGRSGYLRWRADHKKRQAEEVAELLAGHGYTPDEITQVATIVAKRDLKTNRAVQAHEDALCLAFLELQLDDVAEQLGDDHTVEVLRKSIAKMSPRGLAVAGSVALTPHGQELLAAALADPDAPTT